MDSYNTSMVNDCMNYNPVILDEEDIDDKYFALVDHNDPVQSIKNKDRVLFCVDHHIDSNVLEEKYIYFKNIFCENNIFYKRYRILSLQCR